MQIRHATHEDLPAIIAIQNWAIKNTTGTWRMYALEAEERAEWLEDHWQQGYPVLVAEDEDGIQGYASYTQWNHPIPGYRFTVENSIYVNPDAHGKGVGSRLMQALIDFATWSGKVHVIVSNVVSDNEGSLALHKKFGFEEVGRFREVGRKFGKWLDTYFLQLTIPMQPRDPDVDEKGNPAPRAKAPEGLVPAKKIPPA